MKKVIFLAIAAAAALTACSKSEVIDSKYGNDMIGFETYLGRDAQTKAFITETADLTDFGVFGYYTKDVEYTGNIAANLMVDQKVELTTTTEGETVTKEWTYTPVKYWTNATDWYGFLAYAPYSLTAKEENSKAIVTYTVPEDLEAQIDVLYSNNKKSMQKSEVALVFKHALARIAVNAAATEYDAKTGAPATETTTYFDNFFTIKNVSLTGPFNTTGTLDLYTGEWTSNPGTAAPVYELYNGNLLLNKTLKALSTKTEENGLTRDENYLMVLPNDFGTNNAELTVTYTITTNNVVSSDLTKTVALSNEFEAGKAYAINLTLQLDPNNEIKFTVTEVEAWENADAAIEKDVYGTDEETTSEPETPAQGE